MAVITESEERPLQALRDALGTKMLCNDMALSHEITTTDEVFKQSVKRLAESLVEMAKHSGLKPVVESGKIAYIKSGPYDYATIAAKVYAVWAESPMDLVIFCVQAMYDAVERERMAKVYEEEYRGRYMNLLRDLAGAANMEDVRALVRKREE